MSIIIFTDFWNYEHGIFRLSYVSCSHIDHLLLAFDAVVLAVVAFPILRIFDISVSAFAIVLFAIIIVLSLLVLVVILVLVILLAIVLLPLLPLRRTKKNV